jgi:hypothetical protein
VTKFFINCELVLKSMRFIIRAKIPTEAGNKAVQDPNFMKNLEEYMNKTKPESAYFFDSDGDRTMGFVIDMQSTDQIPGIVEPLFQSMGAKVDLHPVMNFDDLKKAFSAMNNRS